MFIFNIKLKSKQLFKTVLIISFILCISLLLLATFKAISGIINNKTYVTDEFPCQDVAKISADNYTNILKEVHEDINTYIGQKINFSRICI